MTESSSERPARGNWRGGSACWILIACSVALACGRVATVESRRAREKTPLLSANDRSRWCTVRSLGDDNTYAIDDVIAKEGPIRWDSIDKVRHLGSDGQMHFYSSKPPLFPTVVAGGYKLLKAITGWEIKTEPFQVVRTLLLLVNVIPWGIFLWFAARMIGTTPVDDWTRYYVLACAAFGTYLLTFVVTLNNHLPAAVCVMVSLYWVSELWQNRRCRSLDYLMVGGVTALAVANELPALAYWASVGLLCLIRSPAKTFLAFVPASGLVAFAFFGTNFLAYHDWRPPYAHRGDGTIIATVEGDFSQCLEEGKLPSALRSPLQRHWGTEFAEKELQIGPGSWPGTPDHVKRWVVRAPYAIKQATITTVDQTRFDLHAWNNWYDYPSSYWLASNDPHKSEVDRGEASRARYAFHLLLGHHGIFSLTPIWILSFAGLLALIGGAKPGGVSMRWLGLMGLGLSVIVLAFYIHRPMVDRNYGGVSSVARWLLWLVPIWLMAMLPVVASLSKTGWGKGICLVLLFASVVSATIPADNPWVHPWLYELLKTVSP